MGAIIIDDIRFNFSDDRLYQHMAAGVQHVLVDGGSFVMSGDDTTSVLVNPYRFVKFDHGDAARLELNDEWVRAIVQVLKHTHRTALIPEESGARAALESIDKTLAELSEGDQG